MTPAAGLDVKYAVRQPTNEVAYLEHDVATSKGRDVRGASNGPVGWAVGQPRSLACLPA
jgi:hypothetical protein